MREAAAARHRTLTAQTGSGPEDALPLCDAQTLDLLASFQHAVTGILIRRSLAAAEALGARSLLVSGGVAANRELRRRFPLATDLPVAFPSLALATDNAAMIAAAAWPRFLAHDFAPDDMGVIPQLKLG